MKGQYLIIKEIILFAIGVAITTFVVVSFQGVEENTKLVSAKDQLSSVSHLVLGGIVKATEAKSDNVIKLTVPEDVSGEVYRITLQNNELRLSIYSNPLINVTQKVFNITESYFMTGDVVSTARFIDIQVTGNVISLKRAVES